MRPQLIAMLLLAGTAVAQGGDGNMRKDVEPRAKSPEASRKSIRVRPGFQVELMAAEPLVMDPIAFEWGADGTLWIVEMGDYPLGEDGKGKPAGIVRFLEDTDGNGSYDKSTVFMDGLGFPTGVMPWRDGVLVACAPDIFYAEDTDRDGKADKREVLYTGFTEGNQQHRVNGFELGLDGWIYGANGHSGGEVKSLKTGRIVNIRNRDFRFKPDTGEFETEAGQTQYGKRRDDWNQWFGNENPTWGWQVVFHENELKRNPQFAPLDVRQTLEPDTNLYPISRTLPRFNDLWAANKVTSANSPTPYRDELFGPQFADSLFVSDPVHNLVHRMQLAPDGATLRGHRFPDETNREFLASSDNWTRPTMMKTGPDGALWVADMYRAVIEHPDWIPDDWEAKLDLRAGHDKGRLYRVVPVQAKPRPIPRLDQLDTLGLVAAMESPNGWQRDTVQRLLLHRRDVASIAPLRQLVVQTKQPKTRIQALWTLRCLDGLRPGDVQSALGDPHPMVRQQALRAGEDLLDTSPSLLDTALKLADDPDARVRMGLILALGGVKDKRAGAALAKLARRDAGDPWARAAILSSAGTHAAAILAGLFEKGGVSELPGGFVANLFTTAGSSGSRAALGSLLSRIAQPVGDRFEAWQFAAMGGLLDAAERGRTTLAKLACAGSDTAEARDAEARVFAAARNAAPDAAQSLETRLAAARLLGREPSAVAGDRDLLLELLRPQEPAPLQQEAVATLGRWNDPKVPERLLAGWKSHAPALRGAILDHLLSRQSGTASLLSALEDTCVPASEIDPSRRQQLLSLRDEALRRRAEAVFSAAISSRAEVLERYKPAMSLGGNKARGAELFRKHCGTCHALRGEGTAVGPDLAALTDKSPESLLISILDPNRVFEAQYSSYNISTTDGRVLTGIIANETATGLTLRRQEGKEDTLLRGEIEELSASGQSLMPEGIERDLSPQDIADVMAYLGSS